MSVIVTIELSVKPERLQELKDSLEVLLPSTRAYDGAEAIQLTQDVEDENHIVFVEYWASKEHFEKYMAWRTETGVLDQLMGMVTQPPKITILNDTAI